MNPVSGQVDITLRCVCRSVLSGIMLYYKLEYDYNNIHVYAHCIIFQREMSWLYVATKYLSPTYPKIFDDVL